MGEGQGRSCSPSQVRRLRARASCFSFMGRSSSATSCQPSSGVADGAHQKLVRGGLQGDGQAHDDLGGGDGDGPFDVGEVLVSDPSALFHFRLLQAQLFPASGDAFSDEGVV